LAANRSAWNALRSSGSYRSEIIEQEERVRRRAVLLDSTIMHFL